MVPKGEPTFLNVPYQDIPANTESTKKAVLNVLSKRVFTTQPEQEVKAGLTQKQADDQTEKDLEMRFRQNGQKRCRWVDTVQRWRDEEIDAADRFS